jgi:hypothetical protein
MFALPNARIRVSTMDLSHGMILQQTALNPDFGNQSFLARPF